jgi:uncharacterized membrane protein YdjX (TVP38/TMEM64 family)
MHDPRYWLETFNLGRVPAAPARPTDATKAAHPNVTTATGRSPTTATMRFGVLVTLVAGLGVLALANRPSRHGLLATVHHHHLVAPLIAVIGSAVLVVALTPRTLLAFVGGALFGTLAGTGYVLVGVTAGALLAFCTGRFLGRDFVASHLRGRVALVERAVARRALLAVTVSRLIPLVPFGISNYALGTASVPVRPYLVGTLLGAAPATVAYAALGAATMRGDGIGAAYAGLAAGVLGIGGMIGTYLVWRRRPRRAPVRQPAGLPHRVLATAAAE